MQLPVINSPPPPTIGKLKSNTPWRAVAVHSLRMLLLASFLAGLHAIAARQLRGRGLAASQLPLDTVQVHFPSASQLAAGAAEGGLVQVLDDHQALLGVVAQTSPQTDKVVGYAGPSNVLLVMDREQCVRQAVLLSSRDTHEHVRQVEVAEQFWQQFVGWRWGELPAHKIDGVSGATLTSLAIAESIVLRMSGSRQSLRFPDPIGLLEVQQTLPLAFQLVSDDQHAESVHILDATGKSLGSAIRTGPLVDSIEGYQGPSELVLFVDDRGIVQKIRLRRTFDNEPYVRYVKQESSFWAAFHGKSLAELAEIDLEQLGIEGVSGATMTSMAATRTLREACRQRSLIAKPPANTREKWLAGWNWSWTEVATATLALAVIPWSYSRQRGRRRTRFAWQLAALVVLGVLCGNLLSLALVAGWTRGGVPFRLAPGLCLLLAVSYIWPAISKRNVYCDQLCPHGIIQQWLARLKHSRISRLPSGMSGPRKNWVWMQRRLHVYLYTCIFLALGWLVFAWPVNLAWLEPFDAYAWRIGLSVSLSIWIASLVLAWHKPMVYCRWACPTGKTLEYVRLGANRWRIGTVDAIMALLTVLLWLAVLGSIDQ